MTREGSHGSDEARDRSVTAESTPPAPSRPCRGPAGRTALWTHLRATSVKERETCVWEYSPKMCHTGIPMDPEADTDLPRVILARFHRAVDRACQAVRSGSWQFPLSSPSTSQSHAVAPGTSGEH